MEKLHKRTANFKSFRNKYFDFHPCEAGHLEWSFEKLQDEDVGHYLLKGHLVHLENWFLGNDTVEKGQLGLNFIPTQNNRIETLSDKKQFWPSLMNDLEKAKSSIHITLFGFQGDAWGKKVTNLLARKVSEGVKVRMIVDALGARMHWYFKHSNKDFIEEIRKKGIEVILTKDKNTKGNFHFDHRKFFVIDGNLAYNTGYTIEHHMRHIHFDMGMRIQGNMVKQLQSHFLTSYFYFGGKISDVDTPNFKTFFNKYYPALKITGQVEAHLLTNIPWVQHRATESYYKRIAEAKEKIVIINEFFSEPKFLEIVKKAAKKGIEIDIIYPRVCEWTIHKMTAYALFEEINNLKNVNVHLYDGPQDFGWLHTKGIVIDDDYINFGSTNMDSPSLYHNYELNIETKDSQVVNDVKEKIIDYAIKYSKPYKSPKSSWEQFKIWSASFLSTIPQSVGAL
jgi:cardiolipin synthase